MLITYTQELLPLVEHDTVTNLEGIWLRNSCNESALCKCDAFALNLFYPSLSSLKENRSSASSFIEGSYRSWKTQLFSLRQMNKNILSDFWTWCLLIGNYPWALKCDKLDRPYSGWRLFCNTKKSRFPSKPQENTTTWGRGQIFYRS